MHHLLKMAAPALLVLQSWVPRTSTTHILFAVGLMANVRAGGAQLSNTRESWGSPVFGNKRAARNQSWASLQGLECGKDAQRRRTAPLKPKPGLNGPPAQVVSDSHLFAP
jgi:hypothetical protein